MTILEQGNKRRIDTSVVMNNLGSHNSCSSLVSIASKFDSKTLFSLNIERKGPCSRQFIELLVRKLLKTPQEALVDDMSGQWPFYFVELLTKSIESLPLRSTSASTN